MIYIDPMYSHEANETDKSKYILLALFLKTLLSMYHHLISNI